MADNLPPIEQQIIVKADEARQVNRLTKDYERLVQAANKAKQATGGTTGKLVDSSSINSLRQLGDVIDDVDTSQKKATTSAKGFTSGLFSLRNIARTALGTFEAMAIFLVTQFVGSTIKKAIESVSQLEQSFIKLAVAERAISGAGVDVTPKELADISRSVADTYKTVSEIDSQKMVADLAVLTKDLKLSAAEYRSLAMAIPLVAQQAGVTIDSATEQVINGLTKSGRGWADLGITVDANIIKQRAITDKIVESAEAYANLTAEQKQQVEVQALINILLENTNENLQEQDNYLKTIEGSTKVTGASWEDLLGKIGQIARPAIIEALSGVNGKLMEIDQWLEKNKESWNLWGAAVSAGMVVATGMVEVLYQMMAGQGISLDKISKVMEDAKAAYQTALANPLGELPADTPTAPQADTGILKDNEDLQKALEKMNNEILEAQLKLAQDMEDAAIDLGRKMEDITIEYAKKRADAERDYASSVTDINRDYANKIADINAKQREARAKAQEDERQREEEHQNKMQELREKFLMDLEDALHARDARQILKLIKQYELEKAQAERDFELKQEQARRDAELRQKSFADERAAAERDRRARLADAQQDYADKLAKLKADEEAERAAAQLKYDRELEDLNKQMQDRFEIIAANLLNEFNLTEAHLKDIVNLYRKYYADASGIMAAMRTMLAGQINIGGVAPTTPTSILQKQKTGGGSLSGIKAAEGGTFVADRPTTVTFGEAGLEAASFTPMNRQGADVNKMFTNLSGDSQGANGQVSIELLLSPDLESRIVSSTLNQTAKVFTKIQRSK